MISPCRSCHREGYGGCPDGTGKTARATLAPFDRDFRAKLYSRFKHTAIESAAAKQQEDMLERKVFVLEGQVVVLEMRVAMRPEKQQVDMLERKVVVLEEQVAMLLEIFRQKSSHNTPRASVPQNDTQYVAEIASWI